MSQLTIKISIGDDVNVELNGDSTEVQKIYKSLLDGDLYKLSNALTKDHSKGKAPESENRKERKITIRGKPKGRKPKKFSLSADQQRELKEFIEKMILSIAVSVNRAKAVLSHTATSVSSS